jgi:hypothetical protein
MTAVLPPPDTESPQAHFERLRAWVSKHCMPGHPIRDSAYSMAMSALAHRLLKYGPDESTNNLTARDLCVLLLFSNGKVAEYLMRTAYFRAIVEGDHEVYEHFNMTLFVPECRAWYWKLSEALMSKAPDPDEVTQWLEGMTGEERGVAHLICGRVYPDLAHISWLDGLETRSTPGARLAAELCQMLLQKPEYKAAVERFLRENPHVRYA